MKTTIEHCRHFDANNMQRKSTCPQDLLNAMPDAYLHVCFKKTTHCKRYED